MQNQNKNTCPACNHILDIPDGYEGRKGECPHCGCKFIIGVGEIVSPPTQLVEEQPSQPSQQKAKGRNLVPVIIAILIFAGAAYYFFPKISISPTEGKATQNDKLTDTSNNNGSLFKKVATVSGVDVVVRNTPITVRRDSHLDDLFTNGAESFRSMLEQSLKSTLSSSTPEAALIEQIESPTDLLTLTRYELIRITGADALDQVRMRTEGIAFLEEFLSNQEWLDDFLVTGLFGKDRAAVGLHALCSIYRYDKECTTPLYRKLACAYAHDITGKWEDDTFHYRLLDRFQAQKKGHQAGRMHLSFDSMESWEMRYITSNDRMGDSRSINYMLAHLHYPRGKYMGACWSIAYRRNNILGDSIHGRNYYNPWKNGFQGEPLKHKVGGVCGTLSNYGSFLARAHGVPGFAVGQPGHCAYMIRRGDDTWSTAYSVTGNTGARSIFGSGDESIVRLMQAAYDNKSRPQLLRAYRHNWQANALQLFVKDQFSLAEQRARKLSLAANPLHLNHWNGYAERLTQTSETSHDDWKTFSLDFIEALGHWQRPCWEFISRHITPRVIDLPTNDYHELMMAWHKAMPTEGKIHGIGGRLADHLKSQAKAMKTPEKKAFFFEQLLTLYTGRPEFTKIIVWGQKEFATKPETAPIFLKTIESYSKANSGGMKGASRTFSDIIVAAEKNGDFQTFKTASILASELFPDMFSKSHHASPATLEKAPKQTQSFRGKLLSANAIPSFSANYDGYSPLAHYAALQPDCVGFLLSKRQKSPTLTIKLPGKCRLSGIVTIGRFENKKYVAEHVPFTISKSLDGKTWEDVVTITSADALHEHDLSALAPEAQYIRFYYKDKETTRIIDFRAVRIYGTPLY